MNADYVKDVRRFAAAGRLKDEDGEDFNVSHGHDIDPAAVDTDGRGNVIGSPLVWQKECYGRLERYVRAHIGFRSWHDDNGDLRPNETPCDRCAQRSPGIYKTCGDIVSERARSNAAIEASFDAWMAACGDDFGPGCFTGRRAHLWDAFLQSIIDHGGWTNVNDDQVKLEALRQREDARRKRNAATRKSRKRQRDRRRGTTSVITQPELQALQIERDRRAAKLKSLRNLSGRTPRAMLWLTNLPDSTCDRTADVWWARELLSRHEHKVTGKAIAEQLIGQGCNYGLGIGSLTSRVHEDLRRIAKLEDDRAGAPLWAP
jgi:hypothetical protein